MITSKGLSSKQFITWTLPHFIWLTAFMGAVAALYYFKIINITVPWLPVSVIGTAVAFYVGFKNSQAYDRMWEARKIWGSIVNDSRAWGMMIDGFVSSYFSDKMSTANQIHAIKQRLIYRHIAWLYVLRDQLLQPTSWEHISQGGFTTKAAIMFQNNFGIGLVGEEVNKINFRAFLSDEEHKRLFSHKNVATQLINEQSRDLAAIREDGLIDDFRHMEMVAVLRSLYEYQGKCERIKKFPLPRTYANMSRYFVALFIILFPFAMIPELINISEWGILLAIPICVMIGWVYVTMELVGDYSENPFQGMASDIPMLSLCRTIEIDLREILGETDLPEPIKAKDNVLM